MVEYVAFSWQTTAAGVAKERLYRDDRDLRQHQDAHRQQPARVQRHGAHLRYLVAVVIAIPVTLVVHDVAYSLARSIWTGFASANVTNYGFYLHVVKHTRSWNFLEGIGRRTQYA
jgi:hypothetical protein